jgi:hypothetical protein
LLTAITDLPVADATEIELLDIVFLAQFCAGPGRSDPA